METVARALAVYGVLLLLFRLTGRRSLGQITTFDFILLLIISESIQNALVGDSHSMTNGLVLVTTLVVVDIGLSLLKRRSPRLDKYLDGTPLVIVDHGRPLHERLHKARVDSSDILSAARREGLERMEQIKYAVLERNGAISIIPREAEPGGSARERPAA